MVQVSVHPHFGSGLIRASRMTFIPDASVPGGRIVQEPPGCIQDDVAGEIRSQVLAGANSGDVDRWHWRTTSS